MGVTLVFGIGTIMVLGMVAIGIYAVLHGADENDDEDTEYYGSYILAWMVACFFIGLFVAVLRELL